MKWAIDRIEENIVILENIESGDIVEVNIIDFPFEVKEGMILAQTDEGYTIDNEEENKRLQSIQDKFNRLKKQD